MLGLKQAEIEVDLKPSDIRADDARGRLEQQHRHLELLQSEYAHYNLHNQETIEKIMAMQHFFVESKGGVELLATALFGKLTPLRLPGERAAALQFLCVPPDDKAKKEKAASPKSWKTVWAVQKYNVLLLFRSAVDAGLVAALVFERAHVEHVPEARFGRRFCFSIESAVLAAADEKTAEEWVAAAQNAKSWFDAVF